MVLFGNCHRSLSLLSSYLCTKSNCIFKNTLGILGIFLCSLLNTNAYSLISAIQFHWMLVGIVVVVELLVRLFAAAAWIDWTMARWLTLMLPWRRDGAVSRVAGRCRSPQIISASCGFVLLRSHLGRIYQIMWSLFDVHEYRVHSSPW